MFIKEVWDKFTQSSFRDFENQQRLGISKKEHEKLWF